MKDFDRFVVEARRLAIPGEYADEETVRAVVIWHMRALEALAAERAAERDRQRQAPQWSPAEVRRLAPFVANAERAAERSAALDALARNDADEIVAGFQGPIETLRGPRSYSHWGMH